MTVAQDGLDGGETAGRLSDAHRQLLTDDAIQFELPTASTSSSAGPDAPPSTRPSTGPAQAPPQSGPTVQADPSAPPSSPPPSPDLSGSGGGGLDGLMQVFLWVAAGMALAIILYWVYCFFRDRRFDREPKAKRARGGREEQAGWRPEEGQAVQLLDEADVLANEGRYDEAARLLLHRSIGEIDSHRPDLVRPALTSRDIAGHPLLPAAPAASFAGSRPWSSAACSRAARSALSIGRIAAPPIASSPLPRAGRDDRAQSL